MIILVETSTILWQDTPEKPKYKCPQCGASYDYTAPYCGSACQMEAAMEKEWELTERDACRQCHGAAEVE